MTTIPYVWDVPYSDFSDSIILDVYDIYGTKVSDVSHEIINGNISIQFHEYGSYKLVASDGGVKYTKNIYVGDKPSGGNIDFGFLEKYIKDNSTSVSVTDNKNGTITLQIGK